MASWPFAVVTMKPMKYLSRICLSVFMQSVSFITHQSALMMQFVVNKSLNGEYITKRKGMDYTQVDFEERLQEKGTNGGDEDDRMSGDLREAINCHEARHSYFKKVIFCLAYYIPFLHICPLASSFIFWNRFFSWILVDFVDGCWYGATIWNIHVTVQDLEMRTSNGNLYLENLQRGSPLEVTFMIMTSWLTPNNACFA